MPGFMKCINQIARCAEQYRAQRLAVLGLTGCQYSCILNVCRQPGISQEGLAKQICVHKRSVARQLAQLEENGFVRRETDEKDRRVTAVYPTARAREAYPVIRRVLGEWSRYVTGGLSEEDKARLIPLLESMCRRAEAYWSAGAEALPEERI